MISCTLVDFWRKRGSGVVISFLMYILYYNNDGGSSTSVKPFVPA